MASKGERKRVRQAQAQRRQPRAEPSVVEVRTGDPVIKPEDRDGLVWLVKKRRLTDRRMMAASLYRDSCRDIEGGAIPSHLGRLEMQVGGRTPGVAMPVACPSTEAQLRLHEMRNRILRGHKEARLILDAVCGGGRTLREMAAGAPSVTREAERLETVLKFALDLIAEFYWPQKTEKAA